MYLFFFTFQAMLYFLIGYIRGNRAAAVAAVGVKEEPRFNCGRLADYPRDRRKKFEVDTPSLNQNLTLFERKELKGVKRILSFIGLDKKSSFVKTSFYD